MALADRATSAQQVAVSSAKGARRWLTVLFLLSVPLCNPVIHGDGFGYYAYLRSQLVGQNLSINSGAQASAQTSVSANLGPGGAERPAPNGNRYPPGASLLWSIPVTAADVAVRASNHLGASILRDGYSLPYRLALALATATYGFLGLLLSFEVARRYYGVRAAFLGVVGIWWSSSLPVYMYFNPSYSHALSSFTVALLLWYCVRGDRLRKRTWLCAGLLAGLAADVYYPNALFAIVPAALLVQTAFANRRAQSPQACLRAAVRMGALFGEGLVLGLLPTLITHQVFFGNVLRTGYGPLVSWDFLHPALLPVLFSANHGLLVWTPLLLPALVGLTALRKSDPWLLLSLAAVFLAFWYLIASYSFWNALSSFGNRFFISFTPVFVLGLAGAWKFVEGRARLRPWLAACATGVFVAWNLAFIFQWGTLMIPNDGPVRWSQVFANQARVPVRAARTLPDYLLHRSSLMAELELRLRARDKGAPKPDSQP